MALGGKEREAEQAEDSERKASRKGTGDSPTA